MKRILDAADKGTKNALYILVILFALVTVIAKCVEPMQTVKAVDNNFETSEPVCLTGENTSEESFVDLGEFKLTAYCACEKCCGYSADGITATGTTPVQGRTIAVDPSVIPYGSEVVIKGHAYIAEDCGGAIKENRIDIYFDSHEDALEFGVQYTNLYRKDDGALFYTDDPVADFIRWDAEQATQLDKLPRCAECDQPIQTEECYEINEELICPKCLTDNHRRWVDNYAE